MCSSALIQLGAHDFNSCRNADELISKYLDAKREKAISAKKKSRKSTEPPKPEPKKRGRISTKSKADSDEEKLEQSPVRPITKKQKKEKAPASIKKKVEPSPEPEGEEDLDVGEFTSMDKYMHLDLWDTLIDKIDTIERGEEGLFIYGTL